MLKPKQYIRLSNEVKYKKKNKKKKKKKHLHNVEYVVQSTFQNVLTTYARLSNDVKYKMQLSTQCRACGTINISIYVNNFLSTNTTILILSSLVSEF